jgi:hypothetical protein
MQFKLVTVALGLVLVVAALVYLLPPREPTTDAAPAAVTPPATGAAAGDDSPELTVFFSRGDSSVAVRRAASGVAGGPEAALRELLRGPSETERTSGITSWFSAETAGVLRGFRVEADGIAHVDFADLTLVIPGASSSAGSEVLLRELNGTLFQHPEIQAIEYTIGGSCEAFWNWLQYDCEVMRRPGAARR